MFEDAIKEFLIAKDMLTWNAIPTDAQFATG
jgi:hypothetical protein